MANKPKGYLVVDGEPVPKLFPTKEAAEKHIQAKRDKIVVTLALELLDDWSKNPIPEDELLDRLAVVTSECAMLKHELSACRKDFHDALGDVISAKRELRVASDIDKVIRSSNRKSWIFGINALLRSAHALQKSSLARRAAIERHSKDSPKSRAKAFVFDCFRRWQRRPLLYASTAAFARDMVDKQPEALTSTVVVERWVRAWRRESTS